NKIDLVDYDQAVFEQIVAAYRAFAAPLGFKSLMAIPVSALRGDNMLSRSARTPWFAGPALLPYLETIVVAEDHSAAPLRFPVQWVNRLDLDFRGVAGTLAAGTVTVGDTVLVAASRQPAVVSRIVTLDGDLPHAVAGQAVTLVLDREVDISRGDVLSHPG